MKRNLLLFFLFLKEFIISSTIKIIGEKTISYEEEQDFNINNGLRLPNFYLHKIFNEYSYYSNNTTYLIGDLDGDIHKTIIKKEKFLYSLDDIKNKFVGFHPKANKTEVLGSFDFIRDKGDFISNKRILQTTNDKCGEFSDCFNCTSYSDKSVDCYWFKGSCMNNTSPSRIRNWWNYFDNCVSDYSSVSIMNKYCGNLEFDTLPLTIAMNKINNLFGTPYLFCSYTVNLNDPFKLVSVNYTDTVIDSDSTFVLQVTYLDGSIINKTLPSRLEWILQGVISLKFYFFTRRSFTRLPFKIEISNETASSNNYLGLFVSLGVVVFICLICSVCFYKCSRIIIENANRRMEQRRRLNMSRPNLNLMPNEEEDLRRTNQETLNKLLETDLKPMKYNEQINHFHTNCTICLEEFNSSMEVIFLFCKHIFHFKCLKDWLEKNILMPKCPNCNYNVLTGGVIDLQPINNNENNANVNVNFNNNQIININRNPDISNQNINQPIMTISPENNIIEMVQNNINLNQRQIDNPNYIENKARETNIIINSNLSPRIKENQNNENANIYNGYSRIDSNSSSNMNQNSNENNKNEDNYDSNNIQNQIQLSSQAMQINSVEDIYANQENITKGTPNNVENFNKEGFLKRPPPNRPASQTDNRQLNNFIIDYKNNPKNDKSFNNSKNSILNNSKEKIFTEESKEIN